MRMKSTYSRWHWAFSWLHTQVYHCIVVWCACTSNSTMVRVQGWEVLEICKIWGGPTWPYNRINLHRSLRYSQTVCRRRWATLMSLWLHGWKGRDTAIKQHTLVLFKTGDRPVTERTDGWTTQHYDMQFLNYIANDLMPWHKDAGLRDFSFWKWIGMLFIIPHVCISTGNNSSLDLWTAAYSSSVQVMSFFM